MLFHIDELGMPRRPEVEALPTDREVWMDALPDEADLATLGDVEEILYGTF